MKACTRNNTMSLMMYPPSACLAARGIGLDDLNLTLCCAVNRAKTFKYTHCGGGNRAGSSDTIYKQESDTFLVGPADTMIAKT